MFSNHWFYKICLFIFLIFSGVANAEIIIHGTRVVYPSDAREITLEVTNEGQNPALVQVWIDEGDADSTPDQSKAPFVITPPIARVEAQKGQFLRISSLPTANALSKDQETLFWLNILDIPPKPNSKNMSAAPDNFLQLAIRSRIKLFYRPSSIKEDANLAPEKIQWTNNGKVLVIKNPTPFYITMSAIAQQNLGEKVDILREGLMLSPFSEKSVTLLNSNVQGMTFTTISDYGGSVTNDIK